MVITQIKIMTCIDIFVPTVYALVSLGWNQIAWI